MTLDLDDTIAAIATAPGGSLRGIVRISGPNSLAIVERIFDCANAGSLASVRSAACRRGRLDLPRNLGAVPATLYLWPNIKSYTRQPSAELHMPGSPPLLEAVLEAVCQAGARLARPGEFTLRAFFAGRLDLTQAEAVLGVIDAESRDELDNALAQLAGGLARPLANLRERLLELLAHLEAGLDFVDEDIEFVSSEDIQQQLAAAAEQIAALLAQMQRRAEAGRLARIVLRGLPNVGKSSLLNALVGEDAAIVSEIAGTTRDFVMRRSRIGQRDCLITDTAGISTVEAASPLDHAAQELAREQAERADLTLFCLDASRPLIAWEREEIRRGIDQRLIVLTKCDLAAALKLDSQEPAMSTSSRTGLGIKELREAIAQMLDSASGEAGVVAGTADRCRESLRLANDALTRAGSAAELHSGEELIAAEIRIALDELGRVVGAVYTEDILDRIFSRFCIGK